jgi:hypothetical protein
MGREREGERERVCVCVFGGRAVTEGFARQALYHLSHIP